MRRPPATFTRDLPRLHDELARGHARHPRGRGPSLRPRGDHRARHGAQATCRHRSGPAPVRCRRRARRAAQRRAAWRHTAPILLGGEPGRRAGRRRRRPRARRGRAAAPRPRARRGVVPRHRERLPAGHPRATSVGSRFPTSSRRHRTSPTRPTTCAGASTPATSTPSTSPRSAASASTSGASTPRSGTASRCPSRSSPARRCPSRSMRWTWRMLAVFAAGCVFLANQLITQRTSVTLWSGVLSASFVAFPTFMFTWGGVLPNILAIALYPGTARASSWSGSTSGRARASSPTTATATAAVGRRESLRPPRWHRTRRRTDDRRAGAGRTGQRRRPAADPPADLRAPRGGRAHDVPRAPQHRLLRGAHARHRRRHDGRRLAAPAGPAAARGARPHRRHPRRGAPRHRRRLPHGRGPADGAGSSGLGSSRCRSPWARRSRTPRPPRGSTPPSSPSPPWCSAASSSRCGPAATGSSRPTSCGSSSTPRPSRPIRWATP